MKDKISSIYENIYNQELNNRSQLDGKFTSRFTFLVTIITASSIIISSILEKPELITNKYHIEIHKDIFIIFIVSMCLILVILLINILISFYKTFFRYKQNYSVMPTAEIRLFHIYIYNKHLINTYDEKDLYSYLIDSYQNCAYHNAEINFNREKALVRFDNCACLSFILLIILYLCLKGCNYSINWIF